MLFVSWHRQRNPLIILLFLDDEKAGVVETLPDHVVLHQNFDCAFVAIGNPQLRLNWLEKAEEVGYEPLALVRPRAWGSPTASIGVGSVVEPMAVVNVSAIIEKGTLLCAG